MTISSSVANPDWNWILEAKNDPQERKNEELSCFKDQSGWLEASGALTRETRKGWPLLKLMQMGTQGVQMKGALPWLIRWAFCADTEIFVLPWLL
jgi:hypothetical protein